MVTLATDTHPPGLMNVEVNSDESITIEREHYGRI